MRVISYNILDGGVGRADPIAEVIKANRPDVAALVEADDLAVVERIAHRLNMDFVHAAAKTHSVAILSRLPIIESVNIAALDDSVGTSFAMVQIGASKADSFGLAVLHLHPYGTHEDEKIRLQQVSAVLKHLSRWREQGLAHLLVGDFNSNSPTQQIDPKRVRQHTQRDIEANGGDLPREVIKRVLAAGYLDTLHAHCPEKADTSGTFSTQFPGERVDFIFTCGFAQGSIRNAWIEQDRLAEYASDHFPVGVELE